MILSIKGSSGEVGVAMIDINVPIIALELRSARAGFEGTDRCFDHQMPRGREKVGRVTQMTSLAMLGAYLFRARGDIGMDIDSAEKELESTEGVMDKS